MKLLLQSVASILLTSVCAASWPYREIVGVGQSESSVVVAPVYEVAPAIGVLDNDEEVATVIAGPVTGTTIVEGSSSGPVTVLSPVNATAVNDPPLKTNTTEEAGLADDANLAKDATEEPNSLEDSVLIKGASSGPVTLVAPSAAITGAAPSAGTKNGAVASSASVAIENTEESSGVLPMTIKETIGVASAKAVIGPSTGPIIIVGPTAPPIPIANVPTVAPIAVNTETDVVVGPASAINSLAAAAELGNETASTTGASEPNLEISASATATVSSSGNSTVSTSAKLNLITPATRIAAATETATSSIVVSAVTAPTAHASGPAATVSGAAASELLVHPLPSPLATGRRSTVVNLLENVHETSHLY